MKKQHSKPKPLIFKIFNVQNKFKNKQKACQIGKHVDVKKYYTRVYVRNENTDRLN